MKLNRRNFLASAAGVAAGLTAGATGAAPAQAPKTAGSLNNASENRPGGESWNREQAVRAKDEKLLRIGGVFGLWSHMSSSWWRYLNPPEGYASATGMRITHVWCIDPEAGARLAERYDAKLVGRYNEMVGQVDGMFIDDFLATPLMPDMALPYLEVGIPCFFDRPMTSSLSGLAKIVNASKHSGAPFMGASAYEYLREVEMANLRLKGIGNISCYEARNSGTTMYQYALHGLWFTLKCMGVDVERIGHRTADPITSPGITTLEHRRDGRTFYGTLHHATLKNILCSVRAYGANGDFEVTCGDDGRPWYKDVFTYLEMLHSIERMIRTRKPPEPLEYTEAKVRIFLSLLYSAMEKQGAMVEVASLPADWDAGFPKGYSNTYNDEIINKYRAVLKKQ